MPITELNLYKSEWLELVFEDRNKSYGAYDLRKHYADNLFKALGFTTLGFVLLLVGYNFVLTHRPAPEAIHETVVQLINPPKTQVKPPVTPPKPPKVDPPKVNTVRFPPPVVRPDEESKNPPKIDNIKLAVVGQTNIKGTTTDAPIDIDPGPPAKAITEDNEPKPFGTIEINPEFPGGEAALAKFLQRNLRYTSQAADANIGGKVFLSFVVEKDGHLSDIKVVRGLGYGLDEEAIRVLKLVPPWKPGIQNGRPLRVTFTLPISFVQQTDNN
jgi:periplasmic protein TonB